MRPHAVLALLAFLLGGFQPQHAQASATGAVTLSSYPSPLQLYARDQSNTAVVPVNGSVTATGYDSIYLRVYKNGSVWKNFGQKLTYSNGSAWFDLSTAINAGLFEYRIQLYLKNNGGLTLAASADSVVCGDVYMIGGQSNAHPTDSLATFRNEFCRTLGVQTTHENDDPYNPADTMWGLSRGIQGWPPDTSGIRSGPFVVGVWGLRLQQLILQQYQMPTAVFNGAAGGDPIEAELRKSNPLDLSTVYGRILYRIQKARLANKIKAVLWYQGESNSFSYKDSRIDTTYYYYNFVKQLYYAWKQDYPGVQKYYVFQLRPGCGGGSDPRLRELQRTLSDSLPGITVMASAAVPGHNGCHFDYNGYNTLGDNIYRLVAKDFYQSSDFSNINSPNITKAYYTNTAHNEITLVFGPNDAVVWPGDMLVWNTPRSLKDNIFLDSLGGLVASGTASGNTIKLTLTQPVNAKTITYLPPDYYPGTITVYEGPWITNTRGVGALIFNKFPLTNSTTAVSEQPGGTVPARFALEQNYPNPFNPSTTLNFAIPDESNVRMEIFDVLGRTVRTLVDERLAPNSYTTRFDAAGLASGLYFYRLTAVPVSHPSDRFVRTRMMTVVK